MESTGSYWSEFHTIDDTLTQNISRIAVSPDGTKMAIVGEESPKYVVQKQPEAYSNRDIEAFTNLFAEDVKVYDYPYKLQYEGRKEVKKRYAPLFKKAKDLNCKILNRMEIDNIVIDQEFIIAHGKTYSAIAIYEVENEKIITVSFL